MRALASGREASMAAWTQSSSFLAHVADILGVGDGLDSALAMDRSGQGGDFL